jgi:hypothetical protein
MNLNNLLFIVEFKRAMSEGDASDTEIHEYKLSVFTWNLAGRKPEKDINFSQIFASDQFKDAADIAIVGFQEIIELSFFNVFRGLSEDTIAEFADIVRGEQRLHLA